MRIRCIRIGRGRVHRKVGLDEPWVDHEARAVGDARTGWRRRVLGDVDNAAVLQHERRALDALAGLHDDRRVDERVEAEVCGRGAVRRRSLARGDCSEREGGE